MEDNHEKVITPTLLLLSLILGMGVGFLSQKGQLCLSIGLTEFFLMKRSNLLNSFILFVMVSSLGIHVLNYAGLLAIEPVSKALGVNSIIGGFLFGVGMMIAGGCGIGVFYKTGEGKVKSFLAMLGLFAGMISYSIIHPVVGSIISGRSFVFVNDLFPVNQYLILGLFLLIAAIWLYKNPYTDETEKRSWLSASGLGLINVLMLYLLGNPFFIGNAEIFLDPIAHFFNPAFTPYYSFSDLVLFMAALPIGVILGSFLSAKTSGDFQITKSDLGEGLFGGFLLGLGAGIGFCCNYGFLTGIAALSISGFTGFFGILVGAYFGLRIVSIISRG